MSDDRGADDADDRTEPSATDAADTDAGDTDGPADPDGAADATSGASPAPQPASAAARRERRSDTTRPAGRAERTRTTAAAKDRPARAGRDRAASAPARLIRFLREVIAELRKVIWPTRNQLVTYTAVVLVFVVFMVAFVYLLDLGFQRAVFFVFG